MVSGRDDSRGCRMAAAGLLVGSPCLGGCGAPSAFLARLETSRQVEWPCCSILDRRNDCWTCQHILLVREWSGTRPTFLGCIGNRISGGHDIRLANQEIVRQILPDAPGRKDSRAALSARGRNRVYRGLIAVRVIRMVSRTWCVRFLFEIGINNSGFKANTARIQKLLVKNYKLLNKNYDT